MLLRNESGCQGPPFPRVGLCLPQGHVRKAPEPRQGRVTGPGQPLGFLQSLLWGHRAERGGWGARVPSPPLPPARPYLGTKPATRPFVLDLLGIKR